MSQASQLSFISSSTGQIVIAATTASASTTTGALIVSGGVGVGGAIYAGPIYSNGALISTSSLPVVQEASSSNTYWPIMASASTGTLTTATTGAMYFTPSTGQLNVPIFNSTSDISQKTNINIISNGVSIVESLRGVTFDWINGMGSSAGLIAQDVEVLFPQLVTKGPDGIKSLNYNGVIGILVEAIKELNQRVKQLEAGE